MLYWFIEAVDGMEEIRAQDSSFFTGKELKASLNAKGKAESNVVRRRNNIRAAKRAPYNLKAGKCNFRVDGVKQLLEDPKQHTLRPPN